MCANGQPKNNKYRGFNIKSVSRVTPTCDITMIDKLYLRSEPEPQRLPSHPQSKNLTDKYYQTSISFRWQPTSSELTRELLVKIRPTFSSRFRTRIELNPSRYRSFDEVCQSISSLGIPLEALHVCRIDLCADIEAPLSEVRKGFWAPRKRLESRFYSQEPTGFYIGKRPDQIAIYIRDNTAQELTRVERRQWDHKCLVRTLIELPLLAEADPFSDLRHFEIIPREECPALRLEAYDHLQSTITHTSIAEASRQQRRQRNFARSTLPLLRDTSLMTMLCNQFRGNVTRFLSGQWTETI